jgi:cysteine synthase A
MEIRNTLLDAIGETPLIHPRRASEVAGCTILGKAEFMNPGGSIKDRAAKYIVLDAFLRAKGLPVPDWLKDLGPK